MEVLQFRIHFEGNSLVGLIHSSSAHEQICIGLATYRDVHYRL